ncbi:DMT family transporter [Naumannella halotolerans]|uniref:EamA family transporter n=1 Tax=Naumannella halotolerans TaxID=993414 RepID=UPI00370D36E5
MTTLDPVRETRGRGLASPGLLIALVSAATFGTAGAFGSPLMDAGWSAGAVVAMRIGVAAVFLTLPAVRALRGRWRTLIDNWQLIVLYGLICVAATQLFYFNAVNRLSVGVALLLEYLAPVIVVGWLWLRQGQRPRRLTLIGIVLAITGLVLVLNLTGSVRLDPIGVAWGLAAALGLSFYFVLSARQATGLPPIVMAWAGMLTATAGLLLVGLSGVMPLQAGAAVVNMRSVDLPWWLPVLWIGGVAAAIAYATGIAATRLLGSKVASFVGLTEVMFAVLFAWLLLGELPLPVQFLGGLLIIVGVLAIKIDEARGAAPMPEVADRST